MPPKEARKSKAEMSKPVPPVSPASSLPPTNPNSATNAPNSAYPANQAYPAYPYFPYWPMNYPVAGVSNANTGYSQRPSIPPVSPQIPVNPVPPPVSSQPKVLNAPWHKASSSSKAPQIQPSLPPSRPSYSAVLSQNSSKASSVNVNVCVKTAQTQLASTTAVKNAVPVAIAPKEEWSGGMKHYVERAFSSCRNAIEKDQMEEALRIKIKEAISSGKMSKIIWATEPLPQTTKANAGLPKLPPQPKAKPKNSLSPDETKKLERARRFDADQEAFKEQQRLNQLALKNVRIEDNLGDVLDWDEYTIVGTCQKLEKPYLRLTAAPDPATVRPLPVLKSALKMLKEKWRTGSSDYGYICDQFKSLRQDLTVQRIKSDFTVQVYEIHARIAIEQGDLGQYNQCQTQLKALYSIGLRGNEREFMAYRLLYLLSSLDNAPNNQNRWAINQFLKELRDEERNDPTVIHALSVHSAIARSDYFQFFKLYRSAPNMSGYFIDLFLARERSQALKTILRAYRPTISVVFLSESLAFDDASKCIQWLEKEFVFPQSSLREILMEGKYLDCKLGLQCLLNKL